MPLLRILADKCIGCGQCVDACLYSALLLENGLAVVNDSCTACGACLEVCPEEALELERPEATAPAPGAESAMGVWVWVEQFDGQAQSISWEMIGQARRLADELGTQVTACVLGEGVGGLAQEAIAYGADRVLLVDDPTCRVYRTEPYSQALVALVQQYRPAIFLLGASARGRDLAGAVATVVDTGLTADCTGLDIDPETGLLRQTRPAFGGNIMATILCPRHRPQMATVRHRVFELPTPDSARQGQILSVPALVPEEQIATRVVDFLMEEGDVNLADAKIIISGGRGVGGPAGFAPLRALAELLGAAVGASRAAVDAGWISYAHQVGQTGRTVRPDVYIACGISGAIQHLAGMQTAKVIIAINRDPEAPIFKVATLGLVGDVNKVLPELTRQLRERLAK